MSALTFKVGGDTSGLKKAVGSAKGMLSGLAGAVKKLSFGGVAAGLAGATGAAVGLKKALDLGGRLSDVAANTGLLAGEALVLEQAFGEAGISSEKLQATIQKMQKSIVEAGDGLETPRRALEEIGVSLEELEGNGAGEQFRMISEALAAIEDPAERSARAMQIFGRSGGELGALFSNPEALKNAAASVGDQAEMLTRGAGAFDRSADILGNVGAKLRGFFVGMASYINPVLLPVLEEMNKLDFSKYGAQVGQAVGVLVQAFKAGALPGLLKDGLLVAGRSLVNLLNRGFRAVAGGLMGAFRMIPDLFKSGFQVLMDASFWKGFGLLLKTVFMSAVRHAVDLLPEALTGGGTREANAIERMGEGDQIRQAFRSMGKAMEAGNLGGVGLETAKEIGEGFRKGLEVDDLLPTGELKSGMREVWKTLEGMLEAQKEATEEAAQSEKKRLEVMKAQAVPVPGAKGGLMDGVVKPVVSSLGRVGGATLRGPVNRIDVERNRLLKEIASNTGQAVAAVYS